MHAAEIEFREATKRYPGQAAPAVSGLTLRIRPGELCVLVGPSGGGKTTALKMVNRLVEVDEGEVLVDGRPVRELDATELRRRIGYVIQQVGLFPHMTVAGNVGVVPRLLRWSKGDIRARVEELLDLVGLPPAWFSRRYPAELSGGERQRVGLARALAGDPGVLLMDEPFGALDPLTRERLQDELVGIRRALGKTVLFVTHDVDEAVKLGDRVVVLRDGGVLAQVDDPDAVLARPADDFVARFVGADRGLKRLTLRRLRDVGLEPAALAGAGDPILDGDTTLRDALSAMLAAGASRCVVLVDGAPTGSLAVARIGSILEP